MARPPCRVRRRRQAAARAVCRVPHVATNSGARMSPRTTMMPDVAGRGRQAPDRMAIPTTLYDLRAALSAEVGPDEADVVTAAVVHLLKTHRVTCTGHLTGYRLRAATARGPTALHSDGTRQGRHARRPEDAHPGVASGPRVSPSCCACRSSCAGDARVPGLERFLALSQRAIFGAQSKNWVSEMQRLTDCPTLEKAPLRHIDLRYLLLKML